MARAFAPMGREKATYKFGGPYVRGVVLDAPKGWGAVPHDAADILGMLQPVVTMPAVDWPDEWAV